MYPSSKSNDSTVPNGSLKLRYSIKVTHHHLEYIAQKQGNEPPARMDTHNHIQMMFCGVFHLDRIEQVYPATEIINLNPVWGFLILTCDIPLVL